MTKQAIASTEKRAVTPLHSQERPHKVARFEIYFHQILDAKGNLVGPLPDFAKNSKCLIGLYQSMVNARLFDKKAVFLQRRGQLGTYASSLGQEAIGTGIGSAMAEDDVLFPGYREYAAQFLRGVRMSEILLYWGGNERGMDYQGQRHDFPICVPIGSQAPQAVGAAYAMKLRGEKRVAVCVIGDGGTSKGDFYESLNAAGTWDLPIVFVVSNNRWAISMPRETQTRAETLAQKAIAAGIAGEQVDGNDVIALRYRIELALEKARAGAGPTLIEALSYRLSDHTTADDASRYRSSEELEQQWHFEPLIRLRQYLTKMGRWSDADEEKLLAAVNQEVEQAVNQYLNTPPQAPESMFDYLYECLPAALDDQRISVIQRSKKNA